MLHEKFIGLDGEMRDRTVKSLTGLGRAKFDALAIAFGESCRAMNEERLRQGKIKRIPSGGPKTRLSTPERKLFFPLFHLKTYPTFDVLGFHFGMSSGHAHNHVEKLLPALQATLSTLGTLPAKAPGTPEEFLQLVEKYDDLLIDGTECACVRPQDKTLQEDCHSGKKNACPESAGSRHVESIYFNDFPARLRQRPRLYAHEKRFRSRLCLVSRPETVARPRFPRGR